MPNEHARKCGQKGHNSTACSKACGGGFKLFGVQIDVASGDNGGVESSIRKSKSLGNLQTCNPENNPAAEPSGYLSDGLVHQSSKSHDRKKGKPWSEEEHRSFLVGLGKLGKGDWKGIANNYVPTRNSSQVASHAQKYFIRMSATEKRRRRSSVFDIPLTDQYQYHHVNQSSHVVDPGSQSADKAAEISQPASSSSTAASSSMNIGELNGQASISTAASITTCERPPLSPMKRHGGVPDFYSMLYAPRVTSLSHQGFARQTITPNVAWVPFMTFGNQSNVFVPNIQGTLTQTCAKFVPPPSIAKLPQKGSSQTPGAVTPATNNDELNLNIRKLTL